MTEWTELKTLQDVAAAQARGDEIEVHYGLSEGDWEIYDETSWYQSSSYRSRPRKQTKKIVLREALCRNGDYFYIQRSNMEPMNFIGWLDTPERVVEVES